MIVYNVTLSIQPEIEAEVTEWLREVHIPEVLQTGLFLQAELFKVFERAGDEHKAYAVQYRLRSWEDFERYQSDHAAALQQKTQDRYGEKVLAFRTFLQKEWDLGQSAGG